MDQACGATLDGKKQDIVSSEESAKAGKCSVIADLMEKLIAKIKHMELER
jgi:hypothetical protein